MKEILCIINDHDRHVNVKEGHFTFYVDGTYQWSEWDKNDYAKWKVSRNRLYVMHDKCEDMPANEWLKCNAPEDIEMAKRLAEELAIRKMLESSP